MQKKNISENIDVRSDLLNIILISGKAFNGKDSAASLLSSLIENDGGKVLITHYADLVKYVSKIFWNWNGEKDNYGRTLLQQVGTDIVRKEKPDYWVDFVKDFVKFSKSEWDYVIIPDVRFSNEINTWKNIDGINSIAIRVNRLNFESTLTEEQKRHPSETALDDWEFDYYINAENDMDSFKKEVEVFYALLKGGDGNK